MKKRFLLSLLLFTTLSYSHPVIPRSPIFYYGYDFRKNLEQQLFQISFAKECVHYCGAHIYQSLGVSLKTSKQFKSVGIDGTFYLPFESLMIEEDYIDFTPIVNVSPNLIFDNTNLNNRVTTEVGIGVLSVLSLNKKKKNKLRFYMKAMYKYEIQYQNIPNLNPLLFSFSIGTNLGIEVFRKYRW